MADQSDRAQLHLALRHLEGRLVGLVLSDGTRILDAQLISAGRPGLSSVWILVDGTDNFIPVLAVAEVWEITTTITAATASAATAA